MGEHKTAHLTNRDPPPSGIYPDNHLHIIEGGPRRDGVPDRVPSPVLFANVFDVFVGISIDILLTFIDGRREEEGVDLLLKSNDPHTGGWGKTQKSD